MTGGERAGGRDDRRRFRTGLTALLKGKSLPALLAALGEIPPSRALSPLLAALCHADEQVKWYAVSALGEVVSTLADRDREAARTVLRRLMWHLNDESGNVGWGVLEAFGEILARHEGLAGEYAHLLAAYLRPDSPFSDFAPLQRGLLWGLGRLAGARPGLLWRCGAPPLLLPFLDAPDPAVRGLAARAAGLLDLTAARERLAALTGDASAVTLYQEGALRGTTVGALATAALARLPQAGSTP